jgi:hypothetical protein
VRTTICKNQFEIAIPCFGRNIRNSNGGEIEGELE